MDVGKMYPFSDYDLSAVIAAQYKKLSERIEKYTNDEIMANDLGLLADNCYEEFYIEPITIGSEEFDMRTAQQVKIRQERDRIYSDIDGRTFIDVDGITMKFYFGYTGDSQLFKCRASTWSSFYPQMDLSNGYVMFVYSDPLFATKNEDYATKMMAQLQRDLDGIQKGISYVNSDIKQYNDRLRKTALHTLEERKKKIEQFYELSKAFEIPLQKNDNAKTHIPTKRKISTTAKKYNNEPSYYISDTEYHDIMFTIKHNCSTYERTPGTFNSLEEEDLRNLLLAALNGTYQGGANGEAFRNKGKTDICIERENRAAFVAECKMWSGASQISDSLNQLDSYLTWRDCKTALIIFVKNKDFIAVLDKTKQTLTNHDAVRQVKEKDRNEYECTMVSKTNIGQLITVRVFMFNLYSQPKRSKRIT